MNSKCLNIIKKLNKVNFFTKNDIEVFQFSDKADEGIRVVKSKINKFDIEEFILRSYLAFDDISIYKGLSTNEIYNLLYNETIFDSDKCIELEAIQKDDIKNIFVRKIFQKLDINEKLIKNIFWVDKDILDQIIILNTEQYRYYIHKSIG